MKKSTTDTDIETARLVQIYLNMKKFDYKNNSTYIQNLGETSKSYITDAKDSDIGEFDSDNNISTWRVGIGANGTQGGTIEPAANFNDDTKKAFVSIEGKFLTDDNTTSIDLLNYFLFKASFQTDSITIGSDNAQVIGQCVDLNTTATVSIPPIGTFNVVNSQKLSSTATSIPSDQNSSINALYTKVVGKPFNVKIVSLDTYIQGNENINLKTFNNGNYNGDVNLSIISTPDYSTCSNGDKQCKEDKCKNANLEGFIGTINFQNRKIIEKNIVFNKALKNASFRIDFTNSQGESKHACSFDSFAIRPATYNFDINDTQLTGGKEYSLDINATNGWLLIRY